MSTEPTTQDPQGQGAQSPFPERPQNPPGSEAAMTPRPDYGEESYRGHGRLAGKVKTFGQNTVFGRPAQPIEVATSYVFLASDESRFITGEVIGVAGGKPI